MPPIYGVVLQAPRRRVVGGHAVVRQRQHRLGEARVEIAVLLPAVGHPDEIAFPARRRSVRDAERHRDLVAGVEDDVTVVDLAQQFAHVAVTGVVTDEVAPVLAPGRQFIIVGQLGGTGVGLRDPRDSAMAQFGRVGLKDRLPGRGGVGAFGVFQSVPVDFHVGAEAETAGDAFAAGNVVQSDHDCLILAGGEAERRPADGPAALAVRNFQDEAVRPVVGALLDGGVDRAVGRVNPSGRQQVNRPRLGGVVAEIDLDVMIARHALVLAAAERVEITAVDATDDFGHVVAVVVHGPRDRPRRFGPVKARLRRREKESLIDEHLRTGGMIDDGEMDVIEEVRLPEVGGDAHVVHAVAWLELVAADLDPIRRFRDSASVLGVDVEAERRTPQNVGHEVHPFAVPGEQEWAGAEKTLRHVHRLIGGEVVFRLRPPLVHTRRATAVRGCSPSPK